MYAYGIVTTNLKSAPGRRRKYLRKPYATTKKYLGITQPIPREWPINIQGKPKEWLRNN